MDVAGGSLRIPATPAFTNDWRVAGWRLVAGHRVSRTRGLGVVSTDGATLPTQTPAVWLSALKSDCHYDPKPYQRAHEPSIECAPRRFESLLRLVSTASTSTLQELKSVFDGSEYKGRSVGSSSL
jgi:hypothetical protein